MLMYGALTALFSAQEYLIHCLSQINMTAAQHISGPTTPTQGCVRHQPDFDVLACERLDQVCNGILCAGNRQAIARNYDHAASVGDGIHSAGNVGGLMLQSLALLLYFLPGDAVPPKDDVGKGSVHGLHPKYSTASRAFNIG